MAKKTSESYLFEAVSHADAENRAIEEISPMISGEYIVNDVKRKRFSDVVKDKGERFYNVRVSIITLDEKSGAEKRTSCNMLISADDIHGALKEAEELMGMNDFTVTAISESRILEVYTLE